jgi:proteasome lid subunit RPN8/RPN11
MPPPTAHIDPNCIWQPDVDVAAVTALLRASDLDRANEYGGALYQNSKGEVCYSVPVAGKREQFGFATDPKAGKLVGIYHTHPGTPEASEHDVATASQLKVPSYILGTRWGVNVLRPGSTRGRQLARAIIESVRKSQQQEAAP